MGTGTGTGQESRRFEPQRAGGSGEHQAPERGLLGLGRGVDCWVFRDVVNRGSMLDAAKGQRVAVFRLVALDFAMACVLPLEVVPG